MEVFIWLQVDEPPGQGPTLSVIGTDEPPGQGPKKIPDNVIQAVKDKKRVYEVDYQSQVGSVKSATIKLLNPTNL